MGRSDSCMYLLVYDLIFAHVAGREADNLRDLGHVSGVGYVVFRCCAAPYNGKVGL